MKALLYSTVSLIFFLLSISFIVNPSSDDSPAVLVNDQDTILHTLPDSYFSVLKTNRNLKTFRINSYKEVLDLYDELNYTPEDWQAGIRDIPRAYLVEVGQRWGSETAPNLTTLYKKRLFFRGLAPLIIHANELIFMDRERLINIATTLNSNQSITDTDKIWLEKLADLYKVESKGNPTDRKVIEELLLRVDKIPVSLALAQAAAESGWGTSKFAAQGNAMYGQWSWGKDAMKPDEQRKELGNYGLAAFETIQESVSAYMLNLNTHYAYSDLRKQRAQMRVRGEKLSGYKLTDGLLRYSENGESYISTLRSIMDYNHLNPADSAYLRNEQPIYLLPVID